MEDTTVLFNREDAPRQVILADAFAAGVQPTWTEAIALTRAVAWQLYRGGASTPVPSLDDIALFSTGAVHVEGGRSSDEGQIAGVGQLMSLLVEHVSAPPQVLDVQKQAMANPPVFTTLLEFHNALDFFARPDSKAVLADYHARAFAAIEAMEKSDPYEALKEKTKAAPTDHRKKEKKAQPKKPARWMVVAAGVVVAGIAGALAFYFSGGTSNPAVNNTANAAIATITETANKLQDATNSVVSKLIGGAEATPEAPATAANQTPGAPAMIRRRPLSSNQSSPLLAANAAAVAQPSNVAEDSETPKPVEPEPTPPVDTGIYSARDTAVDPPMLVYPQLPTKPIEGTVLSTAGALDILVLEDGTVAEARLIPQSDRLQDRMMISAAKAWRFRPALKDGRAVRYRVRMPITW